MVRDKSSIQIILSCSFLDFLFFSLLLSNDSFRFLMICLFNYIVCIGFTHQFSYRNMDSFLSRFIFRSRISNLFKSLLSLKSIGGLSWALVLISFRSSFKFRIRNIFDFNGRCRSCRWVINVSLAGVLGYSFHLDFRTSQCLKFKVCTFIHG